MADYIDLIQTEEGDKPVNYNALANKPIQYIESLDEENLVNIRDLASGLYILYGYFRPYAGASDILPFSARMLVNIVTMNPGTHAQVFYPVNNYVQFLSIMVDEAAASGYTYERTDIGLLQLHSVVTDLQARVEALENA